MPPVTNESSLPPADSADEVLLDREMDAICAGLREGIAREVARLRREGLPIYVSDNGKIVDLQEVER